MSKLDQNFFFLANFNDLSIDIFGKKYNREVKKIEIMLTEFLNSFLTWLFSWRRAWKTVANPAVNHFTILLHFPFAKFFFTYFGCSCRDFAHIVCCFGLSAGNRLAESKDTFYDPIFMSLFAHILNSFFLPIKSLVFRHFHVRSSVSKYYGSSRIPSSHHRQFLTIIMHSRMDWSERLLLWNCGF